MTSTSTRPVVGGIYRHYKGGLYKVLSISLHSETLEKLVIYETLYENPAGRYWARPIDMFNGSVEINGQSLERFSLVEEGSSVTTEGMMK